MADQDELARSALNHALQTSWSWDKYLAEIRKNPNYNYKATEWYKAGADLEAAKHASPPSPPPGGLADAQARIFLAGSPLDCLQAPDFMVPVLSADMGNYTTEEWSEEQFYDHLYEIRNELLKRFASVECWCDCRVPSGYLPGVGTGYDVALDVNDEVALDGAWGQCENATEFANAFNLRAPRMIGQLAGLTADQKEEIGADGIHLAFELYRNVMPWQVPDYENVGDGVGGNAIGVYASVSEGATYTPVAEYKSLGYYQPGRDSVYGVGLTAADWAALA